MLNKCQCWLSNRRAYQVRFIRLLIILNCINIICTLNYVKWQLNLNNYSIMKYLVFLLHMIETSNICTQTIYQPLVNSWHWHFIGKFDIRIYSNDQTKNWKMGFNNILNYIVYDNPISKTTISLFSVSLNSLKPFFSIWSLYRARKPYRHLRWRL